MIYETTLLRSIISVSLKEFSKKVADFFSKSIFSIMKKYFSSGFFLIISAYTQLSNATNYRGDWSYI